MEPLTRRQRQVASLVAEGLTNKEIAERLVVSERTAEGHIEQIRVKLGVRTRTQIAAWVLADRAAGGEASPPPEIRYTKSDGADIAYQVLGDGPLDLLAFSSAVLPIDSIDEEPMLQRFHRRLATFSRLIRFDLRGVGMSDPISPADPPTIEQWAHDAIAVLDAAGSSQAAVFAPRDTSLHATFLAATFPERVSALVFMNGTARYTRAPDYPIGIPSRLMENFLDVNMEPDAVERGLDYVALAAPSAAGDPAFRAWWKRAGNRGATPSTARAIQAAYIWADVRPLLPLLRVPTLVLHRQGNVLTRADHGRYLASHIADAKFVELPGADDLYWAGDTAPVLDEIEAFLTGVRPSAHGGRALVTVVAASVVASRSHIASIGEGRWGELLQRFDAAARRQVVRFRGAPVKAAAHEVLATFDGPARAVTCASAVRDAGAQLGLEVRAGVHTGEVVARGDGIDGPAVDVARAVAARAAPAQVLMTRNVVDLLAGSGITTQEHGDVSVRGTAGRWRLFAAGD